MIADLALDRAPAQALAPDTSSAASAGLVPSGRAVPGLRVELDRFLRDPEAFAQAAGVADAAAFLARYRAGVERRLTEVVGVPAAGRMRLATWAPDPWPCDEAPPDARAPGDRDPRRRLPDTPPRMGALLLVGMVVLAAGAAATTLALIKRDAA
jgi:hypothetical protein